MKTAARLPALVALVGTELALAQDGRIVNAVARQRWLGGQGVVWIVVLLVIIVALLAWIALRNRK
jgi:hypothetical protein